MQPAVAAPREGLTESQITYLIRDAPDLKVQHGLELIDVNLAAIEDISGECVGGAVSRGVFNTLHGSASLVVSRELDWGADLVRPYVILSDRQPGKGGTSARFNLGAYYTSRPKWSTRYNPPAFDVVGVDILDALNDPTGSAYAIEAGALVLDEVEKILQGRGLTQYLIDPSASAKTMASPYVSLMDDEKTWLNIVNDLLAIVGYAGAWSDWDGRIRCAPYQTPAERPVEWVYDVDPATSILSPEREYTRDLYGAPNRWVFIRNETDGATPVEGNGIYTYENWYDGPASVTSRAGRTVTKTVRVDAADQDALVTRAQKTIDADVRLSTTVSTKTAINPLHWHMDKVALNDAESGESPWSDVTVNTWTLYLDGADMDHEWSVI